MASDSSDDDMPLSRSNGHRECAYFCLFAPWFAFFLSVAFGRIATAPGPSQNRPNSSSQAVAALLTSMDLGSAAKVSKAEDDYLDRTVPKARVSMPGLSVRNGPITGGDDMDLDSHANGSTKRKSRSSISKINYKDDSEDSDGAPLVRYPTCTGRDDAVVANPVPRQSERRQPTRQPTRTRTTSPSASRGARNCLRRTRRLISWSRRTTTSRWA